MNIQISQGSVVTFEVRW